MATSPPFLRLSLYFELLASALVAFEAFFKKNFRNLKILIIEFIIKKKIKNDFYLFDKPCLFMDTVHVFLHVNR